MWFSYGGRTRNCLQAKEFDRLQASGHGSSEAPSFGHGSIRSGCVQIFTLRNAGSISRLRKKLSSFFPYCSFVFLPLVLPCCFVGLCDFPGSSVFLGFVSPKLSIRKKVTGGRTDRYAQISWIVFWPSKDFTLSSGLKMIKSGRYLSSQKEIPVHVCSALLHHSSFERQVCLIKYTVAFWQEHRSRTSWGIREVSVF